MNAKLIRIDLKPGEDDTWYAVSPDLPAFLITEKRREDVLAQVSALLEAYCAIGGKPVVAHQVEWTRSDDLYWVICPATKDVG